MARPSKPSSVIMLEGKSHRTKAEMKARTAGEVATLTGTPMPILFMRKGNRIAAREFDRIKGLLGLIGKDDALYAQTINTYCILIEECEQIKKIRDKFDNALEDFEERCGDEDMEYSEIMRIRLKMQEQILGCDKQLMTKRKMILDISKENIMTIASALRSVPKKSEEKKKSGMAAFMESRTGG